MADFGIAWFNPARYEKLAKTEKGDRLANIGFSPPEQLRREYYDKPVPNMDLFALGQTMYYCVAGETITGTGYRPLSSFEPSLSIYDPLIARLVQQVPSNRLQSVNAVRSFVNELKGPRQLSDWERDEQWLNQMRLQVEEFNERLQKPVLGWDSYKIVKDRDQINQLLAALADDCGSYNLWWRGGKWITLEDIVTSEPKPYFDNLDNPLTPDQFRQIDTNTWLIDQSEYRVVDLCIHRNTRYERQYVVLRSVNSSFA